MAPQVGFASIASASTWMKVHRPATFYVGLINNYPMGFYPVASLIQDGERHGLRFLPPCVPRSDEFSRGDAADTIRLGLKTVQGVRKNAMQAAVAARKSSPFRSLEDFLQRTEFNVKERRALAGRDLVVHAAKHVRRSAITPDERHLTTEQRERLREIIAEVATRIAVGDAGPNYAAVHRMLQRRFNVASYALVTRPNFETALAYLKQQRAIFRSRLRRRDPAAYDRDFFRTIFRSPENSAGTACRSINSPSKNSD